MILGVIKVTGNSLSPEYNDGDFVLIAKIPCFLFNAKAGDIVVFEHPVYGQLIKKVDAVLEQGDKIFVTGNHEQSIDSRHFGAISKHAIIGKVIWHIKKPAS
ncbi:MAG: S26 family signal peptidase [Chloroflexi bacterium]|nr:S26 family signal peptidase [Chloroflexota bacterium]